MRITGDRELVQALRVLGRGLPTSAIDRSAKNAADPLVKDAIARARVHRQPGKRPKGGHVDENIAIRKNKVQSRHKRSFVIGAVGRAKRILHLLEFGVRPHVQPIRLRGGIHPGHPAFPIIRPALETHGDKIPERFGKDIMKQIERLVLTLNKGGRRR